MIAPNLCESLCCLPTEDGGHQSCAKGHCWNEEGHASEWVIHKNHWGPTGGGMFQLGETTLAQHHLAERMYSKVTVQRGKGICFEKLVLKDMVKPG